LKENEEKESNRETDREEGRGRKNDGSEED